MLPDLHLLHDAVKILNRSRTLRPALLFRMNVPFHVSSEVNSIMYESWERRDLTKLGNIKKNNPKVPVWCALSKNQVVGVYYFDSSTVTDSSYLKMLNNYFLPVLPNLPNNVPFQQDGAPPHYDRRVVGVLNEDLSSA